MTKELATDDGELSTVEAAFSCLGFSSVKLEILQILLHARECSVSELMVEMSMTRNGLRRHLDELRSAGLVSAWRTTHPRGSGPITYWRPERAIIHDAIGLLEQRLL